MKPIATALAVPLGTAALALAIVWPIIAADGVPLFLHDWTWSPYAAEVLWTTHFLYSTWRQTGLGEPNSAISANPLAWLKSGAALFGSGRASLELYLYLSVWAAIGGVYDIARRAFRASAAQAFASATIFAATPLLFDKIASGQSSYWAATAAFAWGLSWYFESLESGSVRSASRACAFFALATVQLHFLIFAWFAYVLAGLVYRTRRVVWQALAGAAGAASLAIPELCFLWVRGPERGADISPPYRYWIDSQSSYPADAFAMLGYAIKYTERALGSEPVVEIVRIAAYVVAALAVVTIVRQRKAAPFTLGLLGVAGVIVTMGSFGPFGASVVSASLSNADGSFFREYYHAAVMYAIAISVLAPLALSGFSTRVRVATDAVPFVLAAALGIASWSGGLGRVLPFVEAPDYGDDLRRAIAPEEARVLFLPVQQPLEVASDRTGGNDGTDWVDATRHSVYRFHVPAPIAALDGALASGDANAVRRFCLRLGISAVIDRSDVRSGADAAATADRDRRRTLAKAFGAPRAIGSNAALFTFRPLPLLATVTRFDTLPAGTADLRDERAAYVDEPGIDASEVAGGLERDAPDASLGWIDRRDAPVLDSAASPATAYGIVTTRRGATATIVVPNDGYALVWAPAGLEFGTTLVRSARALRVALAAGSATVRSHGDAVISEVGERVDGSQPAVAASSLSERTHGVPWRYTFHLSARGNAGIVLREAYDPAWHLSAPGLTVVRHERADGFGNAWLVRGNGTYDVVIDYGWQPLAFALLAVSIVAFIGVAAPGCFPIASSKQRAPTRGASGAS